MKVISKTERTVIRELEASDADFVNELLNTPKFLKYIGDRKVRTSEDAVEFIENRYRKAYTDHGYGLWAVEISDGTVIGMCGFVKRDSLEWPDLGFAFLPDYEQLGYGTECARAALEYGKTSLGFTRINAITSLDNDASGNLLQKLGFTFSRIIDSPEDEKLKLYEFSF